MATLVRMDGTADRLSTFIAIVSSIILFSSYLEGAFSPPHDTRAPSFPSLPFTSRPLLPLGGVRVSVTLDARRTMYGRPYFVCILWLSHISLRSGISSLSGIAIYALVLALDTQDLVTIFGGACLAFLMYLEWTMIPSRDIPSFSRISVHDR
jgi:hypothetical protein